jgi:hypothetical protein
MFSFAHSSNPFPQLSRSNRARRKPRLEALEDRTLLSSNPFASANAASTASALASFGQVPLSFEANQGQFDSDVRFLSRGSGYGLYLTPNEAVLSLQNDALQVQFVGANPKATVTATDRQSTQTNYFIGNDPAQWHAGVASYGKVNYQDLYPGINLVYYGNQQQLEYDFQVAPAADPGLIRLKFDGAQGIELDVAGNLVLHATGGDVVQHAPVLYQQAGPTRLPVAGRFVLEGNNELGFQIGSYDHSKPLTIDPVLSYSTYLGGSGSDGGGQVAVDASGNVYVTGKTGSNDFPTLGAVQTVKANNFDTFVAKLNASGTALLYSTYIGGHEAVDEVATGIAVNAAGEAYVTGYTDASDFPVANAIQPTYGGNGDGFVFKLSASGSTLLYSTYLGGSAKDVGFGIALDSSGNAYVAGYTGSTNFPTANAFQSTYGGGNSDAFLTKLASDGSSLMYSTYLGGSGTDASAYQCVAVDASGSAYLIGGTESGNFPLVNAFQTVNHGGDGGDGFVAKFTPNGSALVYSSLLGGSQDDGPQAVAVDSSGNAYVGGFTRSADFPLVNALQPTLAGGRDTFISKISADGSTIVFSTFLGGSAEDRILSLALDGADNIIVAGETLSPDFPTVNALQSTSGGGWDGFVAQLNASGTTLEFSTYLRGSNDDYGNGVAVDSQGNIYVVGSTSSSDFLTLNALQGSNAGGSDAFIVKLSPQSPPPPSSLSGLVFKDFNDDGQVDFGETGIGGVTIAFTGTDDLGHAVNLSQLTDVDGTFLFLNLRPGSYYLTEAQPAGYVQGINSVGTAGGSLVATDQFFVQLAANVDGLNYNFGERPGATGAVQHGQTASIGFWNNKNGQALIKKFNNGAGTQLADWLAATLPNMFGDHAGANNLAGKNNAFVAALFQQDFVMHGVKLDAQVLATALSVYATNATLDSTGIAAQYGFTVSGDGVGTATVNVGNNGSVFGVANNTIMTILDLLRATNDQAVSGVLFNNNATKRKQANDLFTAINEAGDIG